MGIAIDTIGLYRLSGAAKDAAFGATTASEGDTFQVRNFEAAVSAFLSAMFYNAATAGGGMRVRSPMFHDNVRGIAFTPGQTPSAFLLPREASQVLQAQDTLIPEMLVNAVTETDVGALEVVYTDLLGAAPRLYSWGDISGNISSIKPVEVDVAEAANVGDWADVTITTTENLLKANRDYALLGIVTDTPAVAVGIKGSDTGNFRICAPATVDNLDVSDYFVRKSNLAGLPLIPVINSANAGATFASVLSDTTGTTHKVQLVLALLARNLS